ncbi:MAG: ATP-binding protein [Bacteroidetes bacterium]|nr:ATP-binding protein [Bacteroidota bacterium]
MGQKYIKRQLSKMVRSAINQFPVVMLTGPRQSGKTTLLKNEFPSFRFANLEDPELRSWAIEQPKDFLYNHAYPLIIDEAQYAPGLFSYIQLWVDEVNKPGMFILAGSLNFLVMEKLAQSLSGRSAVLSLLPFSFTEIASGVNTSDTNQIILNGFYPRLFQSIENVPLFYKSYINTYVERDIRQLANIGSLNDFIRFMKLCAGRCSQLLNISSLATEAGISYNTCKSWLSYLTTGFVISLIQPHHQNYNKKVVKTPKIFFTDTGLLCHLLGITTPEIFALHTLRGAIFENLIYSELLKSRINIGKEQDIWFWRDNHGIEIDFLLGESANNCAVEVKSGMNFHEHYLENLIKYQKYNPAVTRMYLIYDGSTEREIKGIKIINWKNIGTMAEPQ